MKWLDIPDYVGKYKACENGEIISLLREVKRGNRIVTIKGQVIKPLRDKWGYFSVYLCKDGVAKRIKVHRIIAKCFLDDYCEKRPVNHKNGNKQDNRLINLEMSSNLENMRHASMIGLRDHLKMEGNPAAVLTIKEVREIRASKKNKSELSREYGVAHKTIRDILALRTWKKA